MLGSPFRFRACGALGPLDQRAVPSSGDNGRRALCDPSLHTDIVEHFQAVLAMHTGSATVPMPGLGAWLSYGLGTFNQALPSYVVLCEHLTYAGTQVWDSNFLPPIHQGVRIVPGPQPIPDLAPEPSRVTLQELEQLMLREVNLRHAASRPDDADLPPGSRRSTSRAG